MRNKIDNLTLWFAEPDDALGIYMVINSNSQSESDTLWWNISQIALDYNIKRIKESINQNNKLIVAKTKNDLVGIFRYFENEDKDKPLHFQEKFDFELFQLFVKDGFHRQGIWSKMFECFLEIEKDHNKTIHLMTDLGNDKAIKFYKKLWFVSWWRYDNWEIWVAPQQVMMSDLQSIYNRLQNIKQLKNQQ